MLECVERLRWWTTKQCFTHAFRPFPMEKVGYTSESPQGKTWTASRCLAPVKSQEQDPDRHASLPSRSSVDLRMAQMVVQGVIQARWRPLLTRWKLIQVWRVRVGVKLSCRSRWIFHGSEKNRTGNELVSEMAKIFPPCATKMFPPKPLPPSAFRFGCARWRVERSHDVLTKAPLLCKVRKLSPPDSFVSPHQCVTAIAQCVISACRPSSELALLPIPLGLCLWPFW